MTCQECGARVESNERHTYQDCGLHHLKRAIEILGKETCLNACEKSDILQKVKP